MAGSFMKLGYIVSLIICLSIFVSPVLAEETPFVVDFSANVTDGYAPLAVQFTNLVTGNQVSGNWTINNETIEGLPGPEYTFISPGSYNVSLTVTDDTNTTLTETKLDYILVRAPLTYMKISFSGAGMWGPNPVIITDKSSGDIIFVGNTSSKDIQVNTTGQYSIQTMPGGWSDILNAPDYGLVVIMDLVKNNLLGLIILGVILMVIFGLIFRR
jgi:PKD repeat protein